MLIPQTQGYSAPEQTPRHVQNKWAHLAVFVLVVSKIAGDFQTAKMPKPFSSGLFGCFDDPRLCVVTFFVPCYTMGRNAEDLGEDCMLIGLLACVGINMSPIVRNRLRAKYDLEGSMLTDTLLHMFLPCCALTQEARHIQSAGAAPGRQFSDIADAGEENIERA